MTVCLFLACPNDYVPVSRLPAWTHERLLLSCLHDSPVCSPTNMNACLLTCLRDYLPVFFFACMTVCLFARPSAWLSVCLFACLQDCMLVCWPDCMIVCLFIHQSAWLFARLPAWVSAPLLPCLHDCLPLCSPASMTVRVFACRPCMNACLLLPAWLYTCYSSSFPPVCLSISSGKKIWLTFFKTCQYLLKQRRISLKLHLHKFFDNVSLKVCRSLLMHFLPYYILVLQ